VDSGGWGFLALVLVAAVALAITWVSYKYAPPSVRDNQSTRGRPAENRPALSDKPREAGSDDIATREYVTASDAAKSIKPDVEKVVTPVQQAPETPDASYKSRAPDLPGAAALNPEQVVVRSGIFISYRRQDEPNFAGRLYDRLVLKFGREKVFIDVDTIELGLGFTEAIDRSLSQCKVMIVIIGKSWLHVTDEEGEARLDNPDDYVRVEIEKALTSSTRMIPVLVEGATVPKSAQLPQSLSPLARRNGISMSHASFASDAERLIETLGRIIKNA
jgi:TIR domain